MNESDKYQVALGKLRGILAGLRPGNPVHDEIVARRDQVLARYQPAFRNPDSLSADEFKTFLYLENNRHWSGLYRKGLRACEDMSKLRQALKLFLDESQPIDKRFQDGTGMVSGMGKALATAILLVMFPDKYGVWNNTSESGLKSVDLWSRLDSGASTGQRYVRVNQVLLNLSRDLGVDLWTLDAAWWAILSGSEMPAGVSGSTPSVMPPIAPTPTGADRVEPLPIAAQRFALERHLQDFLLDNWDHTELGKEWAIYTEDGDDEAGYEYYTPVGRIDLLAKHRRDRRWLVMELKRDQTSDETVGQVLRYMGWVRQHLAEPGEVVEGLVIAHEADDAIRYAISAVPGVRLMLYEVEFRLSYAPAVGGN